MNDAFAEWDGAYVLGALSAEDRRRYEEHLATCADCARGVQELAGVPGMLGRLGADEATSLRADENRLRTAEHRPDRTAAAARRLLRRRRRTRLLATAAVAAALAVGAVGGWSLATAGDASTPRLAAQSRLHPVGGSELSAELSATPVGWGTRLDWSCDYRGTPDDAARGTTPVSYSLVVHTSSGMQTVATWTSEGGEAKHLVAATAIPADSITSVDIRVTGSSTALAEGGL